MQLAYDMSIRAVDETYLIELVRDMSPFGDKRFNKLPQERDQAKTLGLNT